MSDLPFELAQKYRPVKLLHKGAFGTVWHAVQLDSDRPVALKFLSEALLTDENAVARFRHEAEVASRIHHPAVVPFLDFGITADAGYIVFPFVEGCTLREKILAGPLPAWPSLLIAIPLADALAELHRHGVIHRDLKPENVLLAGREQPMLTDFGISKSASSTAHTLEGVVLGTPGYVAPEQLVEQQASPLSDQFSLGVILFEMLAGRRPYPAETPAAEALAHVESSAMPIRSLLPALAPGIAEVVMRMLQKNPADRFRSMREVHRVLQLAAQRMPLSERGSGIDGPPEIPPMSRTRRTSPEVARFRKSRAPGALRTARSRIRPALSWKKGLRTIRSRVTALSRKPRRWPLVLLLAVAAILSVLGLVAWWHIRS